MKKTKLKDMLAFIGIGQCGTNIAVKAESEGYRTGVINTSEEDLLNSDNPDLPNKIIVGDTGGCGKDRTIGQEIVKKEYKKIANWIKESFIDKNEDLKIIYLCFSTSGGTGSGIGPILINVLQKMFENTDIYFSALAVVPESDESTVSLYNSLRCLEELSRLENDIPILIPDNSKNTNNSSRKALYDNINGNIIKSITNFVTERSNGISNMDRKDKLKLLTTSGVQILSLFPLTEVEMKDENSLTQAVNQAIANSFYTSLNFDMYVKRSGFIFEMPEKYTRNINYKLIGKNIGKSNEILEGIYDRGKSELYYVTIILSGLSFPEAKIKEFSDILKKDSEMSKKLLEKSKASNIFSDIFGSSEDIFGDMFMEDGKKKSKNTSTSSSIEANDFNLESLFDQY